jgi:putative flippase GtrA
VNASIRWLRFNAVGAVGMVVQLGVLALLNRVTSHYLVATAAAIEITLLHNFAGHVRYTWRDRAHDDGLWRRCARFHLSNGAVSMAGNLALMPLLVEGARMPVVAANAVAVLSCSVVNFLLSDGWVFSKQNAVGEAVR